MNPAMQYVFEGWQVNSKFFWRMKNGYLERFSS